MCNKKCSSAMAGFPWHLLLCCLGLTLFTWLLLFFFPNVYKLAMFSLDRRTALY